MLMTFGDLHIELGWFFLIVVVFLTFFLVRRLRARKDKKESTFSFWLEKFRKNDEEKRFSVSELEHLSAKSAEKNIVALLDVSGVILSADSRGVSTLDGVACGDQFFETCKNIASMRNVCGAVVSFSTPGGTIPGSASIYDGLQILRAHDKKVIAYVRDLSASGGVMGMVGAQEIFMHRGALTGSVGVLGPTLARFQGVNQIGGGLIHQTFRAESMRISHLFAGHGKAFLSPFSEDDKEIETGWQDILNRGYLAFVEHVAFARGKQTMVGELQAIGAAILDATRARDIGLVDHIGSFEDAKGQMSVLVDKVFDDLLFVRIGKERARIAKIFGLLESPLAPATPEIEQQQILNALSHQPVLALLPFARWLR